ncbi:MAG: SDR family oxidoreductase [Rikenellaceae bacterium]
MKTIFLTGAATGIGREVARLFYNNNYNVAMFDANSSQMAITTEGWDESRYIAYKGDVCSLESLKDAVGQTLAKFNRIDSLILNAGMHQSNTVLSVEDAELEQIFNVNVRGYIYAIKAAMPSMIEQGGGTIVVNASDQSFIGKGCSFSYGLTKGAIGQMIKNIAIDYGKQGISISGVCPGTIDTPLAMGALQRWADRELGGDLEKAIEIENESYVVGRIGTSAEVAQMFYFLANSPFVTGSLHLIDGGLVAQ